MNKKQYIKTRICLVIPEQNYEISLQLFNLMISARPREFKDVAVLTIAPKGFTLVEEIEGCKYYVRSDLINQKKSDTTKKQKRINILEQRLSNQQYIEHAPYDIVERDRQELMKLQL